MPQVPHALRKERARVLREHGAAALHRHLVAQVGVTRRVLTERGGIGRTEQFTAVRLAAPADPGLMLDLTIANHNGKQLIAA
jgi:threonylcarbamoyladenosine tRNA methylthiotransferase MtaB